MSHNPLVSIITSCYNHERHIDEYMAALLSQTYGNIEVVLYDDGSTDGSWEKIASYRPALEKRFPRVICERHDHMGLLLELDIAVKAASGDYFCFLASDDCHFPDTVEAFVSFLDKNPDCGVVHGDADFYFKDRIVRSYRKATGLPLLEGDVYGKALVNNSFFIFAACFRADPVRRYVDFRHYAGMKYAIEDYPMCLDVFKHTRVGYVDRPLARYRSRREFADRKLTAPTILRWLEDSYRIRFDHLKKHDAAGQMQLEVLKSYHVTLYSIAYEVGLKKEFFDSWRWLRKNGAAGYSSPRCFIKAFLISNRHMWSISRYIEKRVLVANSA